MKKLLLAAIATTMLAVSVPGSAAESSVKALMVPKEQMRLDFADGSKHFLLMVRREGKAAGTGPLAGASVTEFGYHDIIPGDSGDPRGYLVFSHPNGDIAYVKWCVFRTNVTDVSGRT